MPVYQHKNIYGCSKKKEKGGFSNVQNKRKSDDEQSKTFGRHRPPAGASGLRKKYSQKDWHSRRSKEGFWQMCFMACTNN